MAKFNHVDLCSGVGGFSLGFEYAGLSRPILFCDIEPWSRQILKKHWPDVPIAEDVKEIANDPDRFIQGRVDILTAGYPCQPFSVAGNQRGTEDPRHIYPYISRIVARKRPTWCVFENVYGHVSLGLDEVLNDLEGQGYSIRPFIVPASAVNAPHKRDRLWIIARNVADPNSEPSRGRGVSEQVDDQRRRTSEAGRESVQSRDRSSCTSNIEQSRENVAHTEGKRSGRIGNFNKTERDRESITTQSYCGSGNVADTDGKGLQGHDEFETKQTRTSSGQSKEGIVAYTSVIGLQEHGHGTTTQSGEGGKTMADTDNEGSQGRLSGGQSKEWQSELGYSGRSSSAHRQPEKDYGSTRSEFCSMADGIPSGMGRFGEHEGWEKEPEGMTRVAVGVPDRVSKLKGLGNAIVPQIAQKIGETIMKIEGISNG